MFQLLIIFCLAFVAETAERKTSIINIQYYYECNEEYLKAYVSHKVTENDFILNITFDVQKPITSIKINPRLDVIKDEFDQNYEVNVISTTINMCNKNSFVKTNVIFRTMLGPFADGLVDAVTCPVKKKLIRFQNCRLSSIIMPPMVPEVKFKLWGELTGVPIGSKKVIKLCSLKTFAEHKRPS